MLGPDSYVRVEFMSMYAEDALLSDERLRSQRLLAIPRDVLENEDFCESVIDNESYMEASELCCDGDMSSKREQSNSKVVGDDVEDCAVDSGEGRILHDELMETLSIWDVNVWKFILESI